MVVDALGLKPSPKGNCLICGKETDLDVQGHMICWPHVRGWAWWLRTRPSMLGGNRAVNRAKWEAAFMAYVRAAGG